MSELNNNKVASLDGVDYGLESTLSGEASCATATNGMIGHCDASQVLGNVVSPTY